MSVLSSRVLGELPIFETEKLMTAAEILANVVLGVDTHLDVHVGAVVDSVGRILGVLPVETTRQGYEQLLAWARGHGRPERAGVEGTGTYGAALTRFLSESGVEVIEVNRPDRAVVGGVENPIRPTQKTPRAPSLRVRPTLCQRPDPVLWRRCASSPAHAVVP